MAIFSDAAGFKYMGDCQWGTLNINYPTQNYLEAFLTSAVSAELTALCTQSGLAFRNVATQANFDSRIYSTSPLHFLWFSASGDIDDRYAFGGSAFATFNNTHNLSIYNSSGATLTDPLSNPGDTSANTNRLYWLSGNGLNGVAGGVTSFGSPSSTVSPFYWVGASNGQYLALFMYQRNWGTNAAKSVFFYAGHLADVNTNFGYYNASNITKGITLFQNAGASVSQVVYGGHYIANAAKATLQTGDAAYAIVCSDAQTPTTQWATDMYVFDNNTTLGFPAMGRVAGMLLGTGSYTLGKPVKIQGSVFPDGGSPWYLPVGTYAGKTLLMRCYSSMT